MQGWRRAREVQTKDPWIDWVLVAQALGAVQAGTFLTSSALEVMPYAGIQFMTFDTPLAGNL